MCWTEPQILLVSAVGGVRMYIQHTHGMHLIVRFAMCLYQAARFQDKKSSKIGTVDSSTRYTITFTFAGGFASSIVEQF